MRHLCELTNLNLEFVRHLCELTLLNWHSDIWMEICVLCLLIGRLKSGWPLCCMELSETFL